MHVILDMRYPHIDEDKQPLFYLIGLAIFSVIAVAMIVAAVLSVRACSV